MADPTFSILIKIREDLAGLSTALAGMQQLNAAARGSAAILDGFGRPVVAAGAALESTGKKAQDLANTKLSELRRGASVTRQTMLGLLGATQALPPGFTAAAGGMTGLLNAFHFGFGPLGIAVAAISTVAGLAYALSNQLAPAARTAQDVLNTTASAAERLANVRLGQLGEAAKTLGAGTEKELAATRQRLELQQRLDQARLSARAATVRADTSLTDEQRAARLAAEDLTQRIEGTKAQLELSRAEEEIAKGRLDTLREIATTQKSQATDAKAAAKAFAEQRANADFQIAQLKQQRASASSSASVGFSVPTPEIDAQIARLEKLRGIEGEAEQKRLERMAQAEAEAAVTLRTDLTAAADAYDRAATARKQLEAAAPDILAAQASEIHAANAAEQEQLRLRAQSRARQQEQLALDRRLAEIAQSRAEIEADRLISAEDKQSRLNRLLDQENALLKEKLTNLDAIISLETNPDRLIELQRDRDTTARASAQNRGERAANEPLGIREQIGADIVSMTDEWGTKAERVAALFTGPLRAGITSARDLMNQLLGTTDYWTQKLGNVAGPMMGALTGAIADMWQQWIAGQVRSFVLENVFRQQRKTEVAAETAMNATNAGFVSVASFGTAALIGSAALLAAMAAFGSFEVGGYTGGTRGRIAGVTHGEEFVFSADAVDAIGRDYLEQMHETARSGGGSRSASSTAPRASSDRAQTIVVGLFNHRSEQRRFAQMEGSKAAYDFAARYQRRA